MWYKSGILVIKKRGVLVENAWKNCGNFMWYKREFHLDFATWLKSGILVASTWINHEYSTCRRVDKITWKTRDLTTCIPQQRYVVKTW